MKSRILYALAFIFITGWAIGFFLFGLGLIIHLLLIAAAVSVIVKLITEK